MSNYINLGGTIRALSTEESLRRVQPVMQKLGITRVADVTRLDNLGIPVTIAIRPNSKNLATSQGKGLTLGLAKISAIMESIETWHAENLPAGDLIGSYNQLSKQYNLLNPNKLIRQDYLIEGILDQDMEWLRAESLCDLSESYLPRDFLTLDATSTTLPMLVFATSTNGLASGNTLAEATCHALYELIERNSFCRWSYAPHKISETLLDLDSITDPAAKGLIQQFKDKETQVAVWDVSDDNDVPVYMASIMQSGVSTGMNLFSGKGAHLDKNIALTRALTEAAQARLTYISGSRDDVYPSYYSYGVPRSSPFENGKLDYSQRSLIAYDSDFDSNIKTLLDKLSVSGYSEIYRYNLTREDIGIPVVRVIIPGMESPTS